MFLPCVADKNEDVVFIVGLTGDISFGPVLEKRAIFLACRFVFQKRTYCIFFLRNKIIQNPVRVVGLKR